jgi:hypothetical protein
MAYTPELPLQESRILRRIAWASQMPMTTAIIEIINHVAKMADPNKVCQECQDHSFCGECVFHSMA